LFRNGRNGKNERKWLLWSERNFFGMGGMEKVKEKGELRMRRIVSEWAEWKK
jgi:hypothetical protein